MRNTIEFEFTKLEQKKFEAACNIAMTNVYRGTKKATTAACEEILANSLEQVPRDTTTLAMSAYYEVRRRSDVKGYVYEGIVGYGGNGDPINPKTGMPASSYMLAVHEDLDAQHPVGKAKFLEDPVREYAQEHFSRTVFKYMKESLAGQSL